MPRSVGSSAAAIGSGPICWGPSPHALIDLEAQRDGLFIFDVNQTYCTQQGQRGENTFSCGNYRKRPPEEQPQAEERRGGRATASSWGC